VGIAPVFPIARGITRLATGWCRSIGARNEELIFWEEKMGRLSDELFKTLDDQGEIVTHALERLLNDEARRPGIAHVVAIGPVG